MADPVTLATSRALLFRAPLAEFVAERKRLSLELKTAGDKDGAKALAAIAKPGASAWAINQLHWHDKPALDAMFAAAATLRKGDLGATAAHRDALAKLRALAAKHLEASGQAATEPLLRRVTTTLSALAAAGTFEPDLPGELMADRDPPGFEAAGALAALPPREAITKASEKSAHAEKAPHAEKPAPVHNLAKARRDAEEKRRAQEARRREEEAKRLAAERARLTAALETAREERKARDHEVAAAKKALAHAESAAGRALAAEEKLAAQLAEVETNRA